MVRWFQNSGALESSCTVLGWQRVCFFICRQDLINTLPVTFSTFVGASRSGTNHSTIEVFDKYGVWTINQSANESV